MMKSVVIDCFPESVVRYRKGYAVVAIDVIRATTMAVSAVAAGFRCYPTPTLKAAQCLARKLDDPILAGELGGDVPPGFDMNNSPADITTRTDVHRPLVLLSTSGTQLIQGAAKCEAAYLACLRNSAALAAYLADRHARVAVIGAGSRGEFREEDQMCCAWIAASLQDAGYQPTDRNTQEIVHRWREKPPEACLGSNSVGYLRRTGQTRDLDFILGHIEDLRDVFLCRNGQVVRVSPMEARHAPEPTTAATARAA